MITFTAARVPLACLGIAALAACASAGNYPPDSAARPAAGVPVRFELPRVPTDDQPGDTAGDSRCESPLMDPRDRTEIRLVRSRWPTGDYEVLGARYGVAANELLRVDCASLVAIGIVRR